MSKAKITPFVIILALALPLAVLAWQPWLVKLVNTTDAVKVQNPDVAQAFYGELKGERQVFDTVADKDFNLYLSLLAPDSPDVKKDFKADVYLIGANSRTLVAQLNGEGQDWKKISDSLAGESYWQGPELSVDKKERTYSIQVYNADNQGKFILLIGNQPLSFSDKLWQTAKNLLAIKQFSNKSAWSLFLSPIGLAYLLFVLILIAIIFWAGKELILRNKRLAKIARWAIRKFKK